MYVCVLWIACHLSLKPLVGLVKLLFQTTCNLQYVWGEKYSYVYLNLPPHLSPFEQVLLLVEPFFHCQPEARSSQCRLPRTSHRSRPHLWEFPPPWSQPFLGHSVTLLPLGGNSPGRTRYRGWCSPQLLGRFEQDGLGCVPHTAFQPPTAHKWSHHLPVWSAPLRLSSSPGHSREGCHIHCSCMLYQRECTLYATY